MTEYLLGDKVPRSNDAVIDFTVKQNGVPTEPTTCTVKWKNPDGSTVETDTLAAGTVFHVSGETASTNPGHLRAKRTVPADAVLQTGYTVTVEGTIGTDPFGPTTLASYEVVVSSASVVQGGATLASVADVKTRLTDISGITLPAGATDQRIQDVLTLLDSVVLTRYQVKTQAELSDHQQIVGKQAEILLAVGDLMVAFRPGDDAAAKIASEYRKRAYEDLDRSRGLPPEGNRRRVSVGLS